MPSRIILLTVNPCAKPNPLHLNTAFNLYFTTGLGKQPLNWLGRGASCPVHGRNLSDTAHRGSQENTAAPMGPSWAPTILTHPASLTITPPT